MDIGVRIVGFETATRTKDFGIGNRIINLCTATFGGLRYSELVGVVRSAVLNESPLPCSNILCRNCCLKVSLVVSGGRSL